MRGIRRQEEKKKTSFLSNLSHFLHELTAMYLDIVKQNEGISLYCKKESTKDVGDFVRIKSGIVSKPAS